MIQFRVDEDGNLQLVIAKQLWAVIKNKVLSEHGLGPASAGKNVSAAAGLEASVVTDDFIKVDMSDLTKAKSLSISMIMDPDQPPCPPIAGV